MMAGALNGYIWCYKTCRIFFLPILNSENVSEILSPLLNFDLLGKKEITTQC